MKILVSLLALCLAVPQLACASHMPKNLLSTTHRIEMTSTKSDGPQDPFTEINTNICSATAVGPHALLTAKHCDKGAATVSVDGTQATIVARMTDDNEHVIYMLDVTFEDYAGFDKDLNVGDEVWLRGNPNGLDNLVRYGHFSGAVNDKSEDKFFGKVIYMFDVNVWHGDSGAALFNKHGKIVAVTSMRISDEEFGLLGALELRFTSTQLTQARE